MSKARDIMQKNVITIELEKTAQYASTILKDNDISFLVVVEDSKQVGIVSETVSYTHLTLPTTPYV